MTPEEEGKTQAALIKYYEVAEKEWKHAQSFPWNKEIWKDGFVAGYIKASKENKLKLKQRKNE